MAWAPVRPDSTWPNHSRVSSHRCHWWHNLTVSKSLHDKVCGNFYPQVSLFPIPSHTGITSTILLVWMLVVSTGTCSSTGTACPSASATVTRSGHWLNYIPLNFFSQGLIRNQGFRWLYLTVSYGTPGSACVTMWFRRHAERPGSTWMSAHKHLQGY